MTNIGIARDPLAVKQICAQRRGRYPGHRLLQGRLAAAYVHAMTVEQMAEVMIADIVKGSTGCPSMPA
jgi:hypothetical protein